MNTKQINGGNTPKGGKDNTRVILTAAGAVAVGTAAGVAGSTLLGDEGNSPDEEKEKQGEEQGQNEQQNEGNGEQLAQTRQESPAQQQPQPQNTGSSQSASGATEGSGSSVSQGGGNTTDHPNGENVEAEALAVAERLVQTDEIDAYDIEELANVNFEESDILYMENGTEIPVAAVTTPDGGQYLLADVNGDRIYDVVYDTEGNLMAGVQAGLNTNDAQLATDEEGGYLPITDADPVFNDDDVNVDILALDDSDHGIDGVIEEIEDELDDLFADDVDESDSDDDSDVDVALEDGSDLDDDSDLEEDLI